MAGVPKFGWHYVDGELVEEPTEQETIRLLCAQRGQTPTPSYATIAGRLNTWNRLLRGRFWSPTTVRSVYWKNTSPEERV